MRTLFKTLIYGLCSLVMVLMLGSTTALSAQDGGIGDEARKRAEEVASESQPVSVEQFESLTSWVPTLVTLLLLLVLALTIMAARLVDFNPFRKVKANGVNAAAMAIFGVLFLGLVFWEVAVHGPMTLPGASSEHGQSIDILYYITLIITGFVFVVTQIVLFYFAWKYRENKARKALYYPDNHKLEAIWTIIPAIGLACMIIPGLKYWYDINHPDFEGRDPMTIELVGEQFQWRIRYPGNDGKLGKAGFEHISGMNPVGVDSSDAAAADDFVPQVKEMYFVKGRPVVFHIRSKDVLHGVFAPHFRVNIYAVPGMPTQFAFVPTKSTEEIRKELNDPDFNYEMMCSQLCGSAHYNMRVQITVVEDEAKYNEWMAQHPTIGGVSNQLAGDTDEAEAPVADAQNL